MKDKIFPILIIIGALIFQFRDKIPFDDIVKFIEGKENVVVVESEPSAEMKQAVSGVVEVVKNSNATSDQKEQAAACWMGASDMWRALEADLTLDKVDKFNQDLLLIYDNKYPTLKSTFPGFSDQVKSAFDSVVGDDPVKLTKEKQKQVADLSYAIGWAFTQ